MERERERGMGFDMFWAMWVVFTQGLLEAVRVLRHPSSRRSTVYAIWLRVTCCGQRYRSRLLWGWKPRQPWTRCVTPF